MRAEIRISPQPKALPQEEGGALTAHYGSISCPCLILFWGCFAIEMAKRLGDGVYSDV